MKIAADRLVSLVTNIFRQVGCREQEAVCIGEHLVKANLSGHDSHGVIRVSFYLQWVREGKLFPNRDFVPEVDTDVLTSGDGRLGFGLWIGAQATAMGIAKCKRLGTALVAVRNSGHMGRIGHYAEQAAEQGLVSLHFANTSGLAMVVLPAGAVDPRMSINPVVIGVPLVDEDPVVLDIAAAATVEGKLKVARNRGQSVAEGLIVDAQGNPTTDPNDFYGPPRGGILPFGGHKGSGLSIMAELLAGALTGGGCSSEGKTQLEQGLFSIYIDPQQLATSDFFLPEVKRYVDFVRSARATEAAGEVLVPGQIEARNRQRGVREGIDLDEQTWQQLVEAAQSVGITDTELAGD